MVMAKGQRWLMAWSLALLLTALGLSCGTNPGVGLREAVGNPAGDGITAGTKGAALIAAVPESGIGGLPLRQRQLLSDPGWNQPYIAAQSGTVVPAPELATLREELARTLAGGANLDPRFDRGAAKGASWVGDSAGPFDPPIEPGEYDGLAPAGAPPYGCNNDGSNASAQGNAIEDLLAAAAVADGALPQYCLGYVREGLCAPNHFNTLVGASKNASAAVYQAYCSVAGGGFSPRYPPADAEVAEISYRSSLVPDGSLGGTCNATAYIVRDYIWRTFTGPAYNLPGGVVDLYNVLIAPSGPQSAPASSDATGTTGLYQPFYFGSVSACYGGAWIIGLTGSSSGCEQFNALFDPGSATYAAPHYWYRPIYGVLLQRWLDLSPASGEPWQSRLGWPVLGPRGFNGGEQQLNSRGAHYLWGMWFERGFMWWVDYDQAQNPNVPDEAHVYDYTGEHVFCAEPEDTLVQSGPPQFYGGSGPLRVNVALDGVRLASGDPWLPPELNATRSEYRVLLPDESGQATVELLLHAGGYGGMPDAQCRYKTYVWAFRDGTVQPAGADYSAAQRTAVHSYGSLASNVESTYVVRVQVQDEVGFAYGDSLPIVVGHRGALYPQGEVLVIRDDAPDFTTYETNFDALLADLDLLGVEYSIQNYYPGIADDFVTGRYKLAIWYRGGPGAATEPDYTVPWTAEEEADFNALLKRRLFLVSQAHGSVEAVGNYSYWGWDSDPDSQKCRRINAVLLTHATDQNMGLASDEEHGLFGWLYVMFGSEMGAGKADTRGPQRLGLPGAWGTNAAERNLLTGSSGKLVSRLIWADGGADVLQFCGRGWYPPFGSDWINPGWTCGMSANPSGSGSWDDDTISDKAFLSYGCSSSGGAAWNVAGPGRFWCWGMPYARLDVTESIPTGMTRAEVLQNVLSWLDETLSFNTDAEYHWQPYSGAPEIVSVTPGYWITSPPSYISGQPSITGVDYPDPTGTDAYRSSHENGPGERYITTTTPGNGGLDCADIDFQFPWYAYITTANGVVETAGENVSVPPQQATDDSVAFGGLLLSDADQNWERYTPPDGQLPNCVLNQQGGGLPPPAVAGYFTSTTGDSGDELRANYGSAAPALSWDNRARLELEAVAHWPQGLSYGAQPARLQWSLYPGHNLFVPGTGTRLADSPDGWYGFRRYFDIDPLANPPGRTGSGWNAAQFQYTAVVGEGRVVSFNYRNIVRWNPDLNLDRDANLPQHAAADKFPIRCRLYTDYSAAVDSNRGVPGVQPLAWPNNQPADSTYVEGGCYVVDTGAALFPFRILDDPAQPDPQESVSGGGGSYQVVFRYILQSGMPEYSAYVELDPELNAVWGSPGAYVFPLGQHLAAAGAHVAYLNLAGANCPPAGHYWVTLQGVDSDVPSSSDEFTYADSQLVLAP